MISFQISGTLLHQIFQTRRRIYLVLFFKHEPDGSRRDGGVPCSLANQPRSSFDLISCFAVCATNYCARRLGERFAVGPVASASRLGAATSMGVVRFVFFDMVGERILPSLLLGGEGVPSAGESSLREGAPRRSLYILICLELYESLVITQQCVD